MDRYLSFWNLMAYDFSGSWSASTAHQAQLFGPANEPSVDQAVQWYRSRGVRPDKLVVGQAQSRRRQPLSPPADARPSIPRPTGMPLYGRSFAQTNGGLGQPFHGVGEGTWEAVSVLPRSLISGAY
jgi:chitinase